MGFFLASLSRATCCSPLLSRSIFRSLSSSIPGWNESGEFTGRGESRYPIPKDSDLESEEALWKLYQQWRHMLKVPACDSHDEEQRKFNVFKTNAKDIHRHNKMGNRGKQCLNGVMQQLKGVTSNKHVPLINPDFQPLALRVQ